eukprot:718493_1
MSEETKETSVPLKKSISESEDESATIISKMVESYTSFEVMSSLMFGFAVSVFFENIGSDAFEDYYVLEILFSNLMAAVLICNAFTMIVMLTYFSVNRFVADKRNDIALIYLRLFSSYRKYARRAFYFGLVIFIVAIIIYIYPQMKTVAVISTTCTLCIGILIILFVLYTMINFQKVFDVNQPRKISLSAAFHRDAQTTEEEQKLDNAVAPLTNEDVSNNYTFLSVVRRGSSGKKFLKVRKNDDNNIYLLLVVRLKTFRTETASHPQKERGILANVDHPFIVNLRSAFRSDTKLYMVFDFVVCELFDHLRNEGRFNEKRSIFYSGEICLGLKYLHANGIIFGDLNPEAILLDSDGHIKIFDHDISDSFKDNKVMHAFTGDVAYLAPEVLQQQSVTKAADWWSLGTLLYQMMYGLPPFYDENVSVMYGKIINDPTPQPKYFSKEAHNICIGLLERNSEKRFGAAEIQKHPFYKGIDWEKLYNKEIEPPFKPKEDEHDDGDDIDPGDDQPKKDEYPQRPGLTYAEAYNKMDALGH